jgi:hypothetical protein
VDDWGREFVGPAQIRSWSDREFIGKRVMLEIGSVEHRGDETVVSGERVRSAAGEPPDRQPFDLQGSGDRLDIAGTVGDAMPGLRRRSA